VITQARLALRLQRFEVIAVVLVTAVVGVSALIVRWRLDSVGVPTGCWDQWFGSGPTGPSADCNVLVGAFLGTNEQEAGKVMAAMAILPLFAGVFLGVPIVAREIEGRTAPTVWALAASRPRWLAGRLLPMLVVLVLALGFVAVASEILWLGREPWGFVPRFGDVGLHGPGVVARALATFGLALLAGALIGRVLPAVIVGVMLCLVLLLGWGLAVTAWGDAVAEVHQVPADQNLDAAFPGGTAMSTGFVTPDGRFLYDWEAEELAPPGVDPYEWLSGAALAEGYRPAIRGIPGTAYPTWSLIETVGFGAIGLLAIALAFPVTDRRRPS
jgi:ABC-type transport system involved in multi-copper enzyme maturation permease subunit